MGRVEHMGHMGRVEQMGRMRQMWQMGRVEHMGHVEQMSGWLLPFHMPADHLGGMKCF